jgi:hypothetical protein
MAIYTSLMPSHKNLSRAAPARYRRGAKQANMRVADLSITTQRARAAAVLFSRIIVASIRHASTMCATHATRGEQTIARGAPDRDQNIFFAAPEFKRPNASFAQNCATFPSMQTQRAHRMPTRAL